MRLAARVALAGAVLASSIGPGHAQDRTLNLMPVPASAEIRSGRLNIDKSFTAATSGFRDARLVSGLERALRRLERATALELPRAKPGNDAKASLVVTVAGAGRPPQALDQEDESYTLDVSDQQARLSAPTVVGALRGLETFLQLVAADRTGYFVPAANIVDQPRFRWRGLLIDVARHFIPLHVLKRNIDGMAAVKLNVLHWHLTEDQGFRIESKRFPRLHELGSDGFYYTQDEIRDVIRYAFDRGIRVVPEFDMPGHVTSWLVGHPELGSAPGPYQIERKWGIMDPALDPTREEVYRFLDAFLREMAELFPDPYLHVGGDENNGKHWNANPKIQAFMKQKGFKDAHELQGYFSQRVSAIIKKHGKRMVGWDEILQPGLPTDALVQSWRGQESLAEGARKGYTGILSNGYYIDLIQPASYHYVNDPIPEGSTLTDAEKARILGGEATMWSEHTTPEMIDSRIWPRTAAIAERLWSPQAVKDVADMYRRLAAVSVWLETLGLQHLTAPGMLLRRLSGTSDIASLQTLVSVVEPVEGYQRGALIQTTQLSPYSRFIDATPPESTSAREFSLAVDRLLGSAPRFDAYRQAVEDELERWRTVQPGVAIAAVRAPSLQEVVPLAERLVSLSTLGLEALASLHGGVAAPETWQRASLAALDDARAPIAGVEFPMLTALRRLVVAAATRDQLAAMKPEEWRKMVIERAAPPKTENR